MKQTTRIIAIAGTKGKTTCVRALHYAINAVHDEAVLGVDTHRIMLGGDPLMSKENFTERAATSCSTPRRRSSLLNSRSCTST